VAPVVHEGTLLGQFALANREGGYDRRDAELAENLCEYLAPFLLHRLSARGKELAGTAGAAGADAGGEADAGAGVGADPASDAGVGVGADPAPDAGAGVGADPAPDAAPDSAVDPARDPAPGPKGS
jgi:hypothetical protein